MEGDGENRCSVNPLFFVHPQSHVWGCLPANRSNKSPNIGAALHACPPGLPFRAFWRCLFFTMMSLSRLPRRPGWSNIFMHSLSPARFAAACPKASLWQLCCQGGPSHSCRCPGLGWEMALEHIWCRRHCARQLQDNYKTTTRQPTRQPTRQLQTWCKINILLVCCKQKEIDILSSLFF